MKKLIVLAGAVLLGMLCFLSSCGDEDTLSAAERADRIVRGWDEAALNLYRYSGRAIEYDGHDGYMVVMTPEETAFPDGEALRDYQAPETSRQCADFVYTQLADCFSHEAEFYIITVICDASGKVLYTYLNGEPAAKETRPALRAHAGQGAAIF